MPKKPKTPQQALSVVANSVDGGTTGARRRRFVVRNESSRPVDPADGVDGAPPNFSRFPVPQVITFQGLISTLSKSYRSPDEAIKHSLDNARYMRNDCLVMECLEARQRGTALLNWHLEPENPKSQRQKALCERLTRLVARTRQFTEYRRNLLEALWFGRYAIQHKFGYEFKNGRRQLVVKDWVPVHGDKLVFRYDDGSREFDPDQVGIRVGPAWKPGDVVAGDRKLEIVDRGMAYFLEPWERSLLAIHKHIIEDAPYESPLDAGSIHGVGIRSRIYWTWFQKQEALAMLLDFLERSAQGLWVYYYPTGNPQAKAEMEQVAKQQAESNVLLVPRMTGDPTLDAYGIERVEVSPTGAESLKQIVHDFFGHQIKRYILGQILSSESDATGLGSGVADLHMDSFNSIIRYDARKLEEALTRELVEPLKLYNEPDAADVQVLFKIDTESTEAEKKLAAVQAAWNMGAKIKASDVMDMIGLSLPQSGDDVLFNPQVVSAGEPADDVPPQEPSSDADLHGALSHALAHAGVGDRFAGGAVDADDAPQPSSDADLAATIALGSLDLSEKMDSPTEEELRRKFGPLFANTDEAAANRYARQKKTRHDDSQIGFSFEDLHPREPNGEFAKKSGGPTASEDVADETLFDDDSTDNTPRDIADSEAEREREREYAFARPSLVGNAGEDLLGSARHRANAWRGLDAAEQDGTAAEMVTRDQLLKHEPHDLLAGIDEHGHGLSAMAMHYSLEALPARPGAGLRSYQPTAADAARDREQFLQVYRDLKRQAESLAAEHANPMTALAAFHHAVGSAIDQLRLDDRYNAIANGLVATHKATYVSRHGGVAPRSRSVPGKLAEFARAVEEKYGDTPDRGTAESHIRDMITGRGLNQSFGRASPGRDRFSPAELYVKHAERQGGRVIDVATVKSGTSFMLDRLKMRGVQYGNSVPDEERQHHLTKAAEAFADLADVLGLPDEQMSLGGRLGLAIGARGHGAAMAHYEPGGKVINLTRKNGVGSLAHEWGHFFDHQAASGEQSNDYFSEQPPDESHPLSAAYGALVKSWRDSGFDARLAKAVRANNLSSNNARYFQSPREKFACTFERYVQRKLESVGRRNTYLAGISPGAYGETNGLWPTDAEIDAMTPAFDAIFTAFAAPTGKDG